MGKDNCKHIYVTLLQIVSLNSDKYKIMKKNFSEENKIPSYKNIKNYEDDKLSKEEGDKLKKEYD